MKKLRIGLVLDDTLDTPDGVQQYVINVGEWLRNQGHDVHYLVGHTERVDLANIHSLSKNVKVRFNGNRMSIPLPTSMAKLRLFFKSHEFDVLHIQVPYSPFMAGRLLKAIPDNVTVVGTFHILPNSLAVKQANKFLSVMNKRSSRRFDEMIAVSKPAAEFASDIYGYNCNIIPNPVNLDQFKNAFSKSTNVNIVFLGRLVERKGSLQLLKAIDYIKKHNLSTTDFKVIIGGKGPLLTRLVSFVNQHSLSDIVTFSGFVTEDDKANFMAQADVAVFPSTGGESFGIVLLEAFAAARGVVIAGSNPGYKSVMGERKDQLVNASDIDEFSTILIRWIDDPTMRKQIQIWQKDHVKQYDINVVGRNIEELYIRALHKHLKT